MQSVGHRIQAGCHTCRERHLKCDQGKPICQRCFKAGRYCAQKPPKTELQFQHGRNPSIKRNRTGLQGARIRGEGVEIFREDNVWIPIPRKLRYISENLSLAESYSAVQDEDPNIEDEEPDNGSLDRRTHDQDASPEMHSTVPDTRSSFDCAHTVLPMTSVTPERRSLSHSHSPNQPQPRFGRVDVADMLVQYDVGNDITMLKACEDRPGRRVSSADGIPGLEDHASFLITANEAFLLQLYRNKLGPWMDSTDNERRFAVEVPERALQNPVLLYAILAYASRHMARVAEFDGTEFDGTVSDMYHGKCLALYIPAMNDAEGYKSAELLAASCILRLFEQITVRDSTLTDEEHHLLGSSAWVNDQCSCPTSGGLPEAAFWLYLREDIWAALSREQPMKADLWSCRVEINFDSRHDHACKWANWMVWLVAEAVMFSFGQQAEDMATAKATWERIWCRTEKWRMNKPPSFNPVYAQDRDDSREKSFPQIYHSEIWHVVGWQYYHIARMLLLTFKPDRPRLGLHYHRNQRKIREEILGHFRALVGLCLCSGQVAPRYQVTMGVLICGSSVSDPYEQRALLDLLERCDSENAWPTATMVDNLKEEWARQP